MDVDRTDGDEDEEGEHTSSEPNRVGGIRGGHVFEERRVVGPEEGDSHELVRSEPVSLCLGQQL